MSVEGTISKSYDSGVLVKAASSSGVQRREDNALTENGKSPVATHEPSDKINNKLAQLVSNFNVQIPTIPLGLLAPVLINAEIKKNGGELSPEDAKELVVKLNELSGGSISAQELIDAIETADISDGNTQAILLAASEIHKERLEPTLSYLDK